MNFSLDANPIASDKNFVEMIISELTSIDNDYWKLECTVYNYLSKDDHEFDGTSIDSLFVHVSPDAEIKRLSSLMLCLAKEMNLEESIKWIQQLPLRSKAHARCATAWKERHSAYRCKTCGTAPSSCICASCFLNGDHEGHDYFIYLADAGGCCDCGDPQVLDPKGFCKHHHGSDDKTDPTIGFSSSELLHMRAIASAVFRRLFIVMCTLNAAAGVPLIKAYISWLLEFAGTHDGMRRLLVQLIVDYSAENSRYELHPGRTMPPVIPFPQPVPDSPALNERNIHDLSSNSSSSISFDNRMNFHIEFALKCLGLRCTVSSDGSSNSSGSKLLHTQLVKASKTSVTSQLEAMVPALASFRYLPNRADRLKFTLLEHLLLANTIMIGASSEVPFWNLLLDLLCDGLFKAQMAPIILRFYPLICLLGVTRPVEPSIMDTRVTLQILTVAEIVDKITRDYDLFNVIIGAELSILGPAFIVNQNGGGVPRLDLGHPAVSDYKYNIQQFVQQDLRVALENPSSLRLLIKEKKQLRALFCHGFLHRIRFFQHSVQHTRIASGDLVQTQPGWAIGMLVPSEYILRSLLLNGIKSLGRSHGFEYAADILQRIIAMTARSFQRWLALVKRADTLGNFSFMLETKFPNNLTEFQLHKQKRMLEGSAPLTEEDALNEYLPPVRNYNILQQPVSMSIPLTRLLVELLVARVELDSDFNFFERSKLFTGTHEYELEARDAVNCPDPSLAILDPSKYIPPRRLTHIDTLLDTCKIINPDPMVPLSRTPATSMIHLVEWPLRSIAFGFQSFTSNLWVRNNLREPRIYHSVPWYFLVSDVKLLQMGAMSTPPSAFLATVHSRFALLPSLSPSFLDAAGMKDADAPRSEYSTNCLLSFIRTLLWTLDPCSIITGSSDSLIDQAICTAISRGATSHATIHDQLSSPYPSESYIEKNLTTFSEYKPPEGRSLGIYLPKDFVWLRVDPFHCIVDPSNLESLLERQIEALKQRGLSLKHTLSCSKANLGIGSTHTYPSGAPSPVGEVGGTLKSEPLPIYLSGFLKYIRSAALQAITVHLIVQCILNPEELTVRGIEMTFRLASRILSWEALLQEKYPEFFPKIDPAQESFANFGAIRQPSVASFLPYMKNSLAETLRSVRFHIIPSVDLEGNYMKSNCPLIRALANTEGLKSKYQNWQLHSDLIVYADETKSKIKSLYIPVLDTMIRKMNETDHSEFSEMIVYAMDHRFVNPPSYLINEFKTPTLTTTENNDNNNIDQEDEIEIDEKNNSISVSGTSAANKAKVAAAKRKAKMLAIMKSRQNKFIQSNASNFAESPSVSPQFYPNVSPVADSPANGPTSPILGVPVASLLPQLECVVCYAAEADNSSSPHHPWQNEIGLMASVNHSTQTSCARPRAWQSVHRAINGITSVSKPITQAAACVGSVEVCSAQVTLAEMGSPLDSPQNIDELNPDSMQVSVSATSCGHSVHFSCYKKLLEKHQWTRQEITPTPICPYCSTPFNFIIPHAASLLADHDLLETMNSHSSGDVSMDVETESFMPFILQKETQSSTSLLAMHKRITCRSAALLTSDDPLPTCNPSRYEANGLPAFILKKYENDVPKILSILAPLIMARPLVRSLCLAGSDVLHAQWTLYGHVVNSAESFVNTMRKLEDEGALESDLKLALASQSAQNGVSRVVNTSVSHLSSYQRALKTHFEISRLLVTPLMPRMSLMNPITNNNNNNNNSRNDSTNSSSNNNTNNNTNSFDINDHRQRLNSILGEIGQNPNHEVHIFNTTVTQGAGGEISIEGNSNLHEIAQTLGAQDGDEEFVSIVVDFRHDGTAPRIIMSDNANGNTINALTTNPNLLFGSSTDRSRTLAGTSNLLTDALSSAAALPLSPSNIETPTSPVHDELSLGVRSRLPRPDTVSREPIVSPLLTTSRLLADAIELEEINLRHARQIRTELQKEASSLDITDGSIPAARVLDVPEAYSISRGRREVIASSASLFFSLVQSIKSTSKERACELIKLPAFKDEFASMEESLEAARKTGEFPLLMFKQFSEQSVLANPTTNISATNQSSVFASMPTCLRTPSDRWQALTRLALLNACCELSNELLEAYIVSLFIMEASATVWTIWDDLSDFKSMIENATNPIAKEFWKAMVRVREESRGNWTLLQPTEEEIDEIMSIRRRMKDSSHEKDHCGVVVVDTEHSSAEQKQLLRRKSDQTVSLKTNKRQYYGIVDNNNDHLKEVYDNENRDADDENLIGPRISGNETHPTMQVAAAAAASLDSTLRSNGARRRLSRLPSQSERQSTRRAAQALSVGRSSRNTTSFPVTATSINPDGANESSSTFGNDERLASGVSSTKAPTTSYLKNRLKDSRLHEDVSPPCPLDLPSDVQTSSILKSYSLSDIVSDWRQFKIDLGNIKANAALGPMWVRWQKSQQRMGEATVGGADQELLVRALNSLNRNNLNGNNNGGEGAENDNGANLLVNVLRQVFQTQGNNTENNNDPNANLGTDIFQQFINIIAAQPNRQGGEIPGDEEVPNLFDEDASDSSAGGGNHVEDGSIARVGAHDVEDDEMVMLDDEDLDSFFSDDADENVFIVEGYTSDEENRAHEQNNNDEDRRRNAQNNLAFKKLKMSSVYPSALVKGDDSISLPSDCSSSFLPDDQSAASDEVCDSIHQTNCENLAGNGEEDYLKEEEDRPETFNSLSPAERAHIIRRRAIDLASPDTWHFGLNTFTDTIDINGLATSISMSLIPFLRRLSLLRITLARLHDVSKTPVDRVSSISAVLQEFADLDEKVRDSAFSSENAIELEATGLMELAGISKLFTFDMMKEYKADDQLTPDQTHTPLQVMFNPNISLKISPTTIDKYGFHTFLSPSRALFSLSSHLSLVSSAVPVSSLDFFLESPDQSELYTDADPPTLSHVAGGGRSDSRANKHLGSFAELVNLISPPNSLDDPLMEVSSVNRHLHELILAHPQVRRVKEDDLKLYFSVVPTLRLSMNCTINTPSMEGAEFFEPLVNNISIQPQSPKNVNSSQNNRLKLNFALHVPSFIPIPAVLQKLLADYMPRRLVSPNSGLHARPDGLSGAICLGCGFEVCVNSNCCPSTVSCSTRLPTRNSLPDNHILSANAATALKISNTRPSLADGCAIDVHSNYSYAHVSRHAWRCGGGLGCFIPMSSTLYIVKEDFISTFQPIHLDQYGQEDEKLTSGLPLIVHLHRLRRVHCLWLSGLFDTTGLNWNMF